MAWTEYKVSNPVVLGKCDLGRDSDGSRETSLLWLDSNEQSWRVFFKNCDMKDLNLETRRPLFCGLDSVQ